MTYVTESMLPLLGWVARASIQAAAVALLVFVVQWTFGKHLGPRIRCFLWWLVLVRLLVPVSLVNPVSIHRFIPIPEASEGAIVGGDHFTISLPVDLTSRQMAAARRSARLETEASSSPLPRLLPAGSSFTIWQVLLVVWLSGLLLILLRILKNTRNAARRIRVAIPAREQRLLALLQRCRSDLKVHKRVELRISSCWEGGPALFGWWNPKLVLPEALLTESSDAELRFVLLHELAHVQRHDIAFNWLISVVQAIHWFNPILWLAFARMRSDREIACDAVAISCISRGENRAYGHMVLKLMQAFVPSLPSPSFAGMVSNTADVERRLRMIVSPPPRTSAVFGTLLFIGLAIVSVSEATPKSGEFKAADRQRTQAQGDTRVLASPAQTNPPSLILEIETLNGGTGELDLTTGATVYRNAVMKFPRQTGEEGIATVKADEIRVRRTPGDWIASTNVLINFGAFELSGHKAEYHSRSNSITVTGGGGGVDGAKLSTTNGTTNFGSTFVIDLDTRAIRISNPMQIISPSSGR